MWQNTDVRRYVGIQIFLIAKSSSHENGNQILSEDKSGNHNWYSAKAESRNLKTRVGRITLFSNWGADIAWEFTPPPLTPHWQILSKLFLPSLLLGSPPVALPPCHQVTLLFYLPRSERKDMRGICSGTFLGIQLHNHWKRSFPFSWEKSDLFN